MDIKSVKLVVVGNVNKEDLYNFLVSKNFKRDKEEVNLTFQGIKLEITEHPYKQENQNTYIALFTSDTNFHYTIYQKLSERFVDMLKGEFELKVFETISIFSTRVSSDNVMNKMIRNRFKKLNENADNVYFEDYKNQNYLVFNNHPDFTSNLNHFELLINGDNEINIKDINKYIKRITNI